MKRTLLLFATVLLFGLQSYGQNGVAINPTGAEADTSAMLDVSSTSKGLLVPRMTEAQRTAISLPAKGLLVYQNDGTEGFYYFDGIAWTGLAHGTYTETDPVFALSAAYGITATNMTNWTTAFGWGDHAGLYRPVTWVPAWNDISGNPFHWSSPANGDLMRYDLSTEHWENFAPEYLTSYTETDPVYSSKFDLTGAASGDLLKFNGTKFVNFTPNFTESNYLFNSRYGVKLLARNDAQANVDFVLSPKGNGAVLVQQPDGTPAYGNNRGVKAVDLQMSRLNATQVASGDYSLITGGARNTTTGLFSVVNGGVYNLASADFSTVCGGIGNSVTAESSTIVGGSNNNATGVYSFVGGGTGNRAPSFGEAVFGFYPTSYTPGLYGATQFNATDRLFVVGNGSQSIYPSNALTILKNANTTIGGSLTINGNGTGTSLALPATRGTSGYVLTSDGSGGTSWAAQAGGTVTGVTGTAPIVSSGGTTPVISISAATTSAGGSMSAADKAKLDKFPEGSASGQMLYWNGTTWVTIANGTTGQLLSMNSSGQPEWRSQLSIITASTLTPTMTSSGVTFKGVVNPNNLYAAQLFEYGTTTDYGNTTETTYYTPSSTNNTISSSLITGLTVGTTYHVRLITQTVLGTFYSNDITFTYLYPGAPLYLGAAYQEGFVFYLDETGQHGKVCAFYDQSASATWYDALDLCAGYSSGTVAPNIFDDWYLPSTNDLTLMYNNLKLNSLGSFSNSFYWSFEAFNDTEAYYVNFGNGNVTYGDKNANYKVRAVRDF